MAAWDVWSDNYRANTVADFRVNRLRAESRFSMRSLIRKLGRSTRK